MLWWSGVVLGCVVVSGVCGARWEAVRPNILFVFGDDIGYGDLSSFGHPTARTPNIDAMATQGVRLVEYLSAANVCSPSRGSLQTGRHWARLGIFPDVFAPTSLSGLLLNETTLGASLKSVGYRTGALGKWHLGTYEFLPAPHHGYDYYFGIPMTQCECVANTRSPGSQIPVKNKTGHYETQFGPCPILNGSTGEVKKQISMLTDTYYDLINVDDEYDAAAEDFIRGAVKDGKPFFFYFASHHTHFAPPEMTGYSLRGLLGDSLSTLDRSVGRLMNLMKELEIEDNTLFIFSSDNGGAKYWGPKHGGSNGHLRCGKSTTYEGGQRVPTVVRWPGMVTPGTINEKMMSSLDWYPTIASLAGFSLNPKTVYDGMDVSAMLFGEESSPRTTFPYFSNRIMGEDGMPLLMAVREGRYKLHLLTSGTATWGVGPDPACYAHMANHTDDPLLFDLLIDPGETVPRVPCNCSDDTCDFPLNSAITYTHGCMPAADYHKQVASLRALAARELANMPWVESQCKKGVAPERFPCCSPGCTPLPYCCHCS